MADKSAAFKNSAYKTALDFTANVIAACVMVYQRGCNGIPH
jgi:hypothetical protein